MKVAKNMDSVFANCTSDELDFDLMFDEDDSLIDAVAGVNEAGIPWTGPDPESEYQLDGDASYSEKDAEGSKDVSLPVSGEVGTTGMFKGKSAESQAHDVTPGIKKAIEEGFDLEDLVTESDDQDQNNNSTPSNDGDISQNDDNSDQNDGNNNQNDNVKEDYTMGSFYDDDESIAESIIASATGYDAVDEAVNTLCEGSVAIDEAFEASTESLEEKVLEKALDESCILDERNCNSVKNENNDLKNKSGIGDKIKGAFTKDDGSINKGKVAGAAIGTAALVGTGAAIKHHLDKKKAQKDSQDAQQESAEFGFYDATAVDEGVKEKVKGAFSKADGSISKCKVAGAALGATALTGAGVAAVKGIKAHNKKKSEKAQNEAYFLQIGDADIACGESALCDTDIVLTGSLKEAYDEFRTAERAKHIEEIAMESYLVSENMKSNVNRGQDVIGRKRFRAVMKELDNSSPASSASSKQTIKSKIANSKVGQFAKAPLVTKDADGKSHLTGKAKGIAGAAVGAAALTGAGIAAKKAYDKKKAKGKCDQQTNESVVYYSPYETYYDEAADCLTVAVYPPVAKLEGAKLGLAGEVIPVDESTCYGYENNYMDSVDESVEAVDEEYVFVLDEKASGTDNLTPEQTRKGIKAAANAAVKYMSEPANRRKAAILAAFTAAATGTGMVVGHVVTKKKCEKKQQCQNESYDQLDDIIESVLVENGIKDKLAGVGDKAHTQALKIPGVNKIVDAIDNYTQKCAKEGKANKPKIIAGAIAAALAAIGVTGIVLHGKKKANQHDNDQDATNEAVDAALEAFADPF